MADVRALLKAKRQEAQISHPLATYSNGQLRCIACGPVKHASAWEGHVGSKLHRTNVARLREEERKADERRRIAEEEEERARSIANGKRKADTQDMDDADAESKRRKVDNTFPADFFSDPSRDLPVTAEDDEQPQAASSSIDAEWERFQRDVVNATDAQEAQRETYESATVMAEPELVADNMEGLPGQEEEEEAKPKDEEQLRREREQDERELIMDRLLEEERAQEEADMKVTILRNRMEALMRKRKAAKAAKAVE
ncbi:hypothetical protein MKEN_00334200 [Mycena kentingensis (nom. inval.)]|nr:hypothetical protein MKEN_00334200 [Mycena kentingensis (nom. inval.)]